MIGKIKSVITKIKRDFFIPLFIVSLFASGLLFIPGSSKADNIFSCIPGVGGGCDPIKSYRCDVCYCPDNIPHCPGSKCLCDIAHGYTEDACPATPTPPPSGGGGGACSGSSAGEKAVCLAEERINAGAVYVRGAPFPSEWSVWPPDSKPPTQFDCSGLTNWSWYWATDGTTNIPGHAPANGPCCSLASSDPFADVSVGDIAYWTDGEAGGHAALYYGGGQIIEAANEFDGLRITGMYDGSCCGLRFVGWYHPR